MFNEGFEINRTFFKCEAANLFWEKKRSSYWLIDAVNQHYENQIGLLETRQEKTDAYWDRQIERYEGEAAQGSIRTSKSKSSGRNSTKDN